MAKAVTRQRKADQSTHHSSGKGDAETTSKSNGSTNPSEGKAVSKSPVSAANNDHRRQPSQGWCLRSFWWTWSVVKWVLLAVVIPPLLNYTSLKSEHSALFPTAALHYDVGQGQKLMLHCSGKGAPTVILESPAGTSADIWSGVRRQLHKITRVCVYDRAGIGFSERPVPSTNYLQTEDEETNPKKGQGSQEFTVERMADDLKRLVSESSSQPQPFILVGLEFGSLVSRFYSHMFDSQIAQVILIDPLSSHLFSSQLWLKHWKTDILFNMQARQMTGALGLNRLALVTGWSALPDFWLQMSEENVTSRQMHFSCHPKHLKSAVDELAGVLDSLHQIKTLSSVKPFPKSLNYTVLYRSKYDSNASAELNDIWRNARTDLPSNLQIPADQLTVIETSSEGTADSLTGDTLTKLVNIVRRTVNDYRRGKALTS